MEMSERNISLRGYLQMMYFLCVKFQDNLLNSLKGMGGSSGGSGLSPPPLFAPGSLSLEFYKYIKIVWTIF
jgi:hypothetical protein